MPKVVQLRSCGEKHRKTAQKADIFQMSIYLCFFEDAGIYIYISHQNGKGLPKIIVVYHIP